MSNAAEVMPLDVQNHLVPCDIRWILDLVAAGSYGVKFTDNSLQRQVEKVKDLVDELIAADVAYNKASVDHRQAERDQVSWPEKPLRFDHPAAVRMREAADRRARVLTLALGRHP